METNEELNKRVTMLSQSIEQAYRANQSMEKALTECSEKLAETRAQLIKVTNSKLLFKIEKKWTTFWSFISVFLDPGESKTSLREKLVMFLKTMWAWTRNGFKLEEEQVALRRFEICKGCPELKKPDNQCKLCGCMMEKKTKLAGASCPLKKW